MSTVAEHIATLEYFAEHGHDKHFRDESELFARVHLEEIAALVLVAEAAGAWARGTMTKARAYVQREIAEAKRVDKIRRDALRECLQERRAFSVLDLPFLPKGTHITITEKDYVDGHVGLTLVDAL